MNQYVKKMVSDAIRQEHADDCLENALTLISQKDFKQALQEATKAYKDSSCIEQKIALYGIINAIDYQDIEFLTDIALIVCGD